MVTLAHANAHRGNDAPYDADYIRRQNVFLRMFGEKCQAVWSDYIYWHPKESAENISLKIGQMIFSGGVPTYSIRYSSASHEQKQITAWWTNFIKSTRSGFAALGFGFILLTVLMPYKAYKMKKTV